MGTIPHQPMEERVPMHPHPSHLPTSYPSHRPHYIPTHNSLPPQSSPSTQTLSSFHYQHSSPPIVNMSAPSPSSIQHPQVCNPVYSQTKLNTVYGKLLGSQPQVSQDINLVEDRGGGESPTSAHGGSDRSSWWVNRMNGYGNRVCTGLNSSWIYKTVLKSPWK